MKQNKSALIISAGALVIVFGMFLGAIGGLSGTVNELKSEVGRSSADAILASANVNEDTVVEVPILYYDQKADECVNLYDAYARVGTRQFEWVSCGYYGSEIETELVEGRLATDFLPMVTGKGSLTANRGLTVDGFQRWFNTVEGVSQNYAATLGLKYQDGEFKYESGKFYPLDKLTSGLAGSGLDNGGLGGSGLADGTWQDGHNHLFTLNLGVPISVLGTGEEEFEITADDDTWVFVGDKLVLDMGGVHEATTGRFVITKEGEVYAGVYGAASGLGGVIDDLTDDSNLAYAGVKVEAGNSAIVRVFHADRNSRESVFKISFKNMVLNITNATLASTEGVQVAYDPMNPGYVMPLGESLTVRPNKSRALVFAVTIEVTVIGILAFVVVFVVVRVVKAAQK